MLNFELYNPTHYIFGKGQIQKLDELIPKNIKILLAYGGGSIFKNGIYNQVKSALDGVEIVEFGGIEPNPKYETLMKAVKIIRKEKIGFILAVGGGSVIDGVKFISGAVHFDGDTLDILRKKILFKDVSKVVPFGTVLTLPATGSEMNSGAVISIETTQEKLTLGGSALFPKFSVCDPTVIESLPKRQLQNGVVDAFIHVMEQYLTYLTDAFLQDRFSESILQTLVQIGPEVVENPSDYKLASNFMWCCTMALNGLIQKGVPQDWATHMIGHELTALYEIDHARTLAVIGPNLYRVMFDVKKEKLAQYGERVWNITEGSLDEKATQAIEKTVLFLHKMGMNTKLSEYISDYEKTSEIILKRFEERGWKGLGENRQVTLEKIKNIIEMSY
ncbi:MAG: iron-containing alcohol dehydrogenase [Flavobacteriaceae bacterium]|jgi:NADP-dependent alcohol dehydrogenase|nr:iron-containing alcohol dehydrogenase [Flavobacteriaceae bacterium]